MHSLIPCIRVNYTIPQLLKAFFIQSRPAKHSLQLKQNICDYFGVNDVILTSSARCAIYLILKNLPQKKVIIPAYTCEVVYDAVCQANKEIIFARVSKETLNVLDYPEIDADTIVIATHQYGNPCEMENLSNLCKLKGAILIEDCAGSLGTTINGRITGTIGDYGVFSFSASKTIQSPTKGGFIIAKDLEKINTIKKNIPVEKCGFWFKISHIIKGVVFCCYKQTYMCEILNRLRHIKNSNNNSEVQGKKVYRFGFYEWQAFIVNKQFSCMDTILSKRRAFFKMYEDGIINTKVQKPLWHSEASNIRYVLLVKNRDYFVEQCFAKGIEVDLGYKRSFCPNSFIEEKEIFKEIVYLPFGNNFSEVEIQKVISVINQL